MENDCNSVAVASNSGGTHSRDASNSPGLEGRDEGRGGKTLKTKHQDWRHSMVLTYQKTSLFSGLGTVLDVIPGPFNKQLLKGSKTTPKRVEHQIKTNQNATNE
uniref:Uncharacterized protein n=1 Tax=Anopheles coluzzii TaxID=1518534 RepID=A0A8W7PGU2_ANOCL